MRYIFNGVRLFLFGAFMYGAMKSDHDNKELQAFMCFCTGLIILSTWESNEKYL